LDLQLYNETIAALFNAGTHPDASDVRDTHLGAWVTRWSRLAAPTNGVDITD